MEQQEHPLSWGALSRIVLMGIGLLLVWKALGAVVDHFSSWINGFGFLTLERIGATQWDVKVWDATGRQVNACSIDGRHSFCELSQVK